MTDAELEKIWNEIDFNISVAGTSLKFEVMEALRVVRDSVGRFPSEADFERFMFLNFGQMDKERSGHHMKNGAKKTYDWLRSHIKTAQPISDEELKKQGLHFKMSSHAYTEKDREAFNIGFRSAEKYHGIGK